MLAYHWRRQRFCVALAIFTVFGPICYRASAQEARSPETVMTEEERREYRTFLPAALDATLCHLAPAAAESDDLISSPEPTWSEKFWALSAAISEEAAYRIGSSFANALPSLGPSTIIGGESWKVVSNTTLSPYKGVCVIQIQWKKFGNNGLPLMGAGTAFFVGKRVLITNAHNVYDSTKGGLAQYITVMPGRNGSKPGQALPFGYQSALKWSVLPEWKSNEKNRDFDIAWIVLRDRYLWDRVGYAFTCRAATNGELRAAKLHLAGYPEPTEQARDWRMYHDIASVGAKVQPLKFQHLCDSLQGSSGGPLYVKDQTRYVVLGVHCASSAKYNVGTRMVSRYIGITNNLKKQYP